MCSLHFSWSPDVIFSPTELMSECGSLSGLVICHFFPVWTVDIECHHVMLTDVFEMQFGASSWSFPGGKFTIQDVLRDVFLLHSVNMTKPV